MMFDNVLIETKGFLDNKNVILTKQNNVHFSRGLNHDFGQKVEISLLFQKWTKIWQSMMFWREKKEL